MAISAFKKILKSIYVNHLISFFSNAKQNREYNYIITRGHNEINDRIFDFLLSKLKKFSLAHQNFTYLDIGCNIGVILEEFPGGFGVDNSNFIVNAAVKKGLNVQVADATKLPFRDKQFDVAILSCVLEQQENWLDVINEAIRVSDVVIGINPIPGSKWGQIGGYVKSVIPIEKFEYVERLSEIDKYYFEAYRKL